MTDGIRLRLANDPAGHILLHERAPILNAFR